MSIGTSDCSSMSLPYRALRYDLVQAAVHDEVWSSPDWVRFCEDGECERTSIGVGVVS